MALRPEQAGLRTCLKCGNPFYSRNAANRICAGCDAKNKIEPNTKPTSSIVYDGQQPYVVE